MDIYIASVKARYVVFVESKDGRNEPLVNSWTCHSPIFGKSIITMLALS